MEFNFNRDSSPKHPKFQQRHFHNRLRQQQKHAQNQLPHQFKMNKLPHQQIQFKVSNSQSQDKFQVNRPSLMEMIQRHPANKVERFLKQSQKQPEALALSNVGIQAATASKTVQNQRDYLLNFHDATVTRLHQVHSTKPSMTAQLHSKQNVISSDVDYRGPVRTSVGDHSLNQTKLPNGAKPPATQHDQLKLRQKRYLSFLNERQNWVQHHNRRFKTRNEEIEFSKAQALRQQSQLRQKTLSSKGNFQASVNTPKLPKMLNMQIETGNGDKKGRAMTIESKNYFGPNYDVELESRRQSNLLARSRGSKVGAHLDGRKMSRPEVTSRNNADKQNNTSESKTRWGDFNQRSPSLRDRSSIRQIETPSQTYIDTANIDRTTVDLNFSAGTIEGLKPSTVELDQTLNHYQAQPQHLSSNRTTHFPMSRLLSQVIGETPSTSKQQVNKVNVKRHIENDLLENLDLDEEDLNDIMFFKKKLVIDDYFKCERNQGKRKQIYQKLLIMYHPDKQASNQNRDNTESEELQRKLLDYLLANKDIFRGEYRANMRTRMPEGNS